MENYVSTALILGVLTSYNSLEEVPTATLQKLLEDTELGLAGLQTVKADMLEVLVSRDLP